ncbi:MAG: hypothetical protein DRN37_08935 [Thermoplasmata archaeon]|nr:MAG: hypothetical protein DRN37_08935 [Thermoplasmata archaeon]
MEKWAQLSEKIRTYINPQTFAVSVSFLGSDDQVPDRAKRPLRDLGEVMAPCQGAGMARRYGWTVAFGPEDVGCAIAAHTYGWERLTEERGAIDFLLRMNYAADEKAAFGVLKGFRILEMDKGLQVVYASLERTSIEPHVVVIYVNPAQMMRLIHGATFHQGTPVTGSFSGRAASCTEGVLGAYLDGECKVVVPGNGDRVWAGCQDHEMIMAIPSGKLADVVEGLEKSHQKGVRYPIPTYLRYRPEVGFSIPLSDIFKPLPRQK